MGFTRCSRFTKSEHIVPRSQATDYSGGFCRIIHGRFVNKEVVVQCAVRPCSRSRRIGNKLVRRLQRTTKRAERPCTGSGNRHIGRGCASHWGLDNRVVNIEKVAQSRIRPIHGPMLGCRRVAVKCGGSLFKRADDLAHRFVKHDTNQTLQDGRFKFEIHVEIHLARAIVI